MVHYATRKPGMKVVDTIKAFIDDGTAKSLLDFGLHLGLFDVERQLGDVPQAFGLGVTSFIGVHDVRQAEVDDRRLLAHRPHDVVGRQRGLVSIHAENGLATDYLEDKYLGERPPPSSSSTTCARTFSRRRRSTGPCRSVACSTARFTSRT